MATDVVAWGKKETDVEFPGELHRRPPQWCGGLHALLIYSMSVSVDGFITDRAGAFGWTVPDEEQCRFHLAQVRELGGYLCGRRLYQTMLVWETDPSLRGNELGPAFADAWAALPKIVFSRTLDSVQGNARLAQASVAEEAAAALDTTDKDVSIGGPGSGSDHARPRRRAPHVSQTRSSLDPTWLTILGC